MSTREWFSRVLRRQASTSAKREELKPIAKLFRLRTDELARWLRGYLRDGVPGIAGEVAAVQHPDSYVKSLGDRKTLSELGIGGSLADEFVEDRIPEALRIALAQWKVDEGLEYLGLIVELVSYFSATSALPILREKYLDADLKSLLRAENPAVLAAMLAALLDLAEDLRDVSLRAWLADECLGHIEDPSFTLLCFGELAREEYGKEDRELIPKVVSACLGNPKLRLSRALERHYSTHIGRIRNVQVFGATIEAVTALGEDNSAENRAPEYISFFTEELFIAGYWLVPCMQSYFESPLADEHTGYHVFSLHRGNPAADPLTKLCTVPSTQIPRTWAYIDYGTVNTVLTDLPGYEINPQVAVATLKGGGS